jgi:hypothetical protein
MPPEDIAGEAALLRESGGDVRRGLAIYQRERDVNDGSNFNGFLAVWHGLTAIKLGVRDEVFR